SLEKNRADKLQKVLTNSAEARKNNLGSRNQITSSQAVTGRELLLMDLRHSKQANTTKKPHRPGTRKAPAQPKSASKTKLKAAGHLSTSKTRKTQVVVDLEVDSEPAAL